MSLADEAKKAELKHKSSTNFIRYQSDRSSGSTITFSDADVVPMILTPQYNIPPTRPKQVIVNPVVYNVFIPFHPFQCYIHRQHASSLVCRQSIGTLKQTNLT